MLFFIWPDLIQKHRELVWYIQALVKLTVMMPTIKDWLCWEVVNHTLWIISHSLHTQTECKQSQRHTKSTTPMSLRWDLTSMQTQVTCTKQMGDVWGSVMCTTYVQTVQQIRLTMVSIHNLWFIFFSPHYAACVLSSWRSLLPATPGYLSGLNYVFPSPRHMSCITNCLALWCPFVSLPNIET